MSLVNVTGLAVAFAGVCALAVAVDSVANATAAPTMISFVITASAVTSAEYLGENDAPIPARAQDPKSHVPGRFCWTFRFLRPGSESPAGRSADRSHRRPVCVVANLPRLPSSQYASWRASYHRTMTQVATPQSVAVRLAADRHADGGHHRRGVWRRVRRPDRRIPRTSGTVRRPGSSAVGPAASVLTLLKGDAGQRAIVAQSMGWRPAQRGNRQLLLNADGTFDADAVNRLVRARDNRRVSYRE